VCIFHQWEDWRERERGKIFEWMEGWLVFYLNLICLSRIEKKRAKKSTKSHLIILSMEGKREGVIRSTSIWSPVERKMRKVIRMRWKNIMQESIKDNFSLFFSSRIVREEKKIISHWIIQRLICFTHTFFQPSYKTVEDEEKKRE